MRPLELSNLEIADLCRELALLLHSGVSAGDGLFLMAEEEKDPKSRELLTGMASAMDSGAYLHQAFDEAKCFPVYITGLLRMGEEVGRTEETLNALAAYYENREKLQRQIVSSLTYPAILLLLMLIVIIVLLSQVLPVFNEIYMSLGGQLTGVAGGLLLLGQFLDKAMPLLCGILAVFFLAAAVLYLRRDLRLRATALWRRKLGDRGIARKMNNARFAQALSMGFSSGMVLEDAVEMAGELLKEIPGAAQRCADCREQLLQGADLATALGENGLLSPSACRLLTLGMRSGTGDGIMETIAQRMQDEAQEALESAVGKVEPALVLVTSGLVGVILLSVMLPLMNIMTAIG